ncbi:MAG: hypothetical protein NUW21_12380 [Elusimicrobia bacterium]|nr:hypothetical protein [Elusimicrobiota bacterium]
MRPLLLVLSMLALPASAAAAEGRMLVGLIRSRLKLIDAKLAESKSPDEIAALNKALAAADNALAPHAATRMIDLSISSEEPPLSAGSNVRAVPKMKRSAPAASPRPDPATEPGACAKLSSYAALACKANEGAAKGSLGGLRSAASIYYGDTEGDYPATLDALIPKHIEGIPAIAVGGHAETNKVRVVKNAAGKSAGAYVEDAGGWLYFHSPDNPELNGVIVIDCKHADHKGKPFWGF